MIEYRSASSLLLFYAVFYYSFRYFIALHDLKCYD
nr:MAG TPA: hypothetical protein [Caudoviricetes sp.]